MEVGRYGGWSSVCDDVAVIEQSSTRVNYRIIYKPFTVRSCKRCIRTMRNPTRASHYVGPGPEVRHMHRACTLAAWDIHTYVYI